MARTRVIGLDSQSLLVEGLSSNTLPSGVTFDATTPDSVGRSLKFVPASGSSASVVSMPVISTEWRRARVMFSVLPTTTARVIAGTPIPGSTTLRIKANGTIELNTGSGAGVVVGTTSFAATVNVWFTLDWLSNTSTSSLVRVRCDGVDQITSSAANLGIAAGLGGNDTVADTYTMFVDDYIGDDAAWPDYTAKVRLLLPISDNARAALWVAGSNATTATTNLFEAVNNTPPVGTTTSNAVTAAISHEGSAAGTTDDYDANMTTYATAGVASGDTVNTMQAVVVTGEDIATGAKLLTFSVKSNPAQGAFETNFTCGVAAVGTYPTNWVITRGTIICRPR